MSTIATLHEGFPSVRDKVLVGAKLAHIAIRDTASYVGDLFIVKGLPPEESPVEYADRRYHEQSSASMVELANFIVDREIGTEAVRLELSATLAEHSVQA